MTLPNWISLFRILLIPVFMVALLGSVPGGDALAVVVFAVAAASDSLDGYLARSRHAVSTIGTLLDPLGGQAADLGRPDLAGRARPAPRRGWRW